MTEAEYRQAEGVNVSTLKYLQKSPAHYLHFLQNPPEDKPAFQFGRAVHSAILTPEAFARDFVVLPEGIDRRTKAGREAYDSFLQENAGREIITAADAEIVGRIAAAVHGNRDAAELLKGTKREETMFWTDENGILCKARADALRPGLIVDLKTTTDAETDNFTREALRYGYDIQCAHYLDGYAHTVSSSPPVWYFIAVEKAEPYAVNILRADGGFIDHGIEHRQQLLELLISCRESGNYPDYGTNDLILPYWAEG